MPRAERAARAAALRADEVVEAVAGARRAFVERANADDANACVQNKIFMMTLNIW